MHVSDVTSKLLAMSKVHPGLALLKELRGTLMFLADQPLCHDVKLILIQGLHNKDTKTSIEVAKMDVV